MPSQSLEAALSKFKQQFKRPWELNHEQYSEWRSDEDFILAIINIHPRFITWANPNLRKSRQFIKRAVSQTPSCYEWLEPTWLDDEVITSYAIKQDPIVYRGASMRLLRDEMFRVRHFKTNSWFRFPTLEKIHQNSFWQSINDAFSLMHGNHGYYNKFTGGLVDPNELYYGLVDITGLSFIAKRFLDFGMPLRPSRRNVFRYCQDDSRTNLKFLRTIAATIGILLKLTELLIALTLTITLVPLVALYHVIRIPFITKIIGQETDSDLAIEKHDVSIALQRC